MKLDNDSLALVSAALRHQRDARQLVSGPAELSPDQAFHLAGFAPECMRKAVLGFRWLDKVIGHSVDESIFGIGLSLDPWARRYVTESWNLPELKNWRENIRYERTGTVALQQAEALTSECENAVTGILFALWLDGRLPEIAPHDL